MKSLIRHAILFGMALILAGCVSSVVDPPSANPTPPSIVESRALAPTNVAPNPPTILPPTNVAPNPPTILQPTPTITPFPVLVTSNRIAGVTRDLSDANLPAGQILNALQEPSASPTPSPNPTATIAKPSQPLTGKELYVHLPPQASPQKPLRVLLVLHGMGGNGEIFSQNLLRDADRNNWLVIAPTFQYQNYLDPKQLMDDDLQFTKRILDTLDVLPKRLNLQLRQHILIYGFSRGAQLAHRFAYFYPDRVESVVTLSAGAYTLPAEKQTTDKGSQIIPFPYGIGDLQEWLGQPVNWQALKKISFWIGVGAQDDQASDVSRAFDQYGGKTRIERAKTFQQALQSVGIDTHLTIFPDSTHEVTSQMRVSALQFLRDDEVADHWDD